MTRTLAGVVSILLVGSSLAEIPPPPDGLSQAYEKAGRDLAAGGDRKAIRDTLRDAIAGNPRSTYLPDAERLARDLTFSIENPARPDDPPERRLAETRVPFHLVAYSDNWDEALRKHRDAKSADPVGRLLAADRSVIENLIPILKDDSPTRAFQEHAISRGGLSSVPRACDYALALIEFHSLCRFFDNASSGGLFHALPDENRAKIAQRIAIWWKENRTESVTAGIRDQIPFADFYAKVWMARTLIRLGEKGDRADREHGLEVLRQLVRNNPLTHLASYTANALAEFGDLSPRDLFYEAWKAGLGNPGIMHDPGIAFYLMKHGGRREWELLLAVSQDDVQNGRDAGGGAVWAAVVNGTGPDTSPYVIPILGLVLQQTQSTGSRSVAGSDEVQSFSSADKAAEHLQKKTGLDFGYKPAAKLSERLAAIDKAQKWWESEGKKKYTFDSIEAELVKLGKK
jgi:hypothetical protein